ncbi:unnamed protein product, partial [Brassica rapa subsp. trilocularis]
FFLSLFSSDAPSSLFLSFKAAQIYAPVTGGSARGCRERPPLLFLFDINNRL